MKGKVSHICTIVAFKAVHLSNIFSADLIAVNLQGINSLL
jgi:hypothetical protein